MRRALHLTVVLLVVLAGCGGSAGPGPAEVATEQQTATPVGPPAGLSMESVTDARSLAETHRDSLDDRSHTVEYRRTLRYENGTVYSRTNETRRVGTDDTTWVEQRVTGTKPLFLGRQPGNVESWSNGSVAVARISTGDQTTYQRYGTLFQRVSFDRVYALYTTFDLVVTGRTGTGADTRYHLSSTAAEANGVGVGPNPARDVSLTVAVDGDGVLRHYNLTYTTTFDNRTLPTTETVRVRTLGETSVPRPEWVGTAVDETEDQPT